MARPKTTTKSITFRTTPDREYIIDYMMEYFGINRTEAIHMLIDNGYKQIYNEYFTTKGSTNE